MSNEDQTTSKKARIGGIGQQRQQYRTIGGQRQDQPQNTLEQSEVRTSERSDTQGSEYLEDQTPKRTKRHTIYLSPKLSRWIKVYAATNDQEISEIAERAIQRYKDDIEHL
jgi:hypothetical protein